MANLRAVSSVPEDTIEYLKNFKGHKTITLISQSGYPTTYDSPTEHTFNLVKQANDKGHHVYFTVNENSSSGRKKENIKRARAIFGDDDVPRSEPRSDFPVEPSLIVQTSSHEQGNKYHYYWLTSTENLEEWELVQANLIINYKFDIAVKDTARILRLPGFVNTKDDPPTKCSIVQNLGTVYEWDSLLQHFPPMDPNLANTPGEDGKSEGSADFNILEHINKFMSAESISPSINSLIAHYAWHYSDTKVKKNIDDMFESVDPEVFEQNKDRYYYAREQVPKFIRTARISVRKQKKEQPKVVPMPAKAKPLLEDDHLSSSPIDRESLPDSIKDAAEELNRFLKNGEESAIITAVSVVCTLLSKNVLIHEMGEHTTTYCNTGVILAMDSGARKTQIYKHLAKPIKEYEQRLRADWESTKHEAESLHKILQEQLKQKESEMKKAVQKGISSNEAKSYAKEMGIIKQEMEHIQVSKPTIYIQDSTEEYVLKAMAENSGCISVVSDDSRNIIKNILGRYKDDTAEGYIINGMGGDVIKYNRMKDGGTEYVIDNPCLNMFLFVQPDLAITLKEHPVYSSSGLSARLPMYFVPINPIKLVRESDRHATIDESKLKPYYDATRSLCVRRFHNPVKVTISSEGLSRLNELNKDLGDKLSNEWRGQYNKVNKMITQAVIYSVCMAALDDAEFREKIQNTSQNEVYELKVKHINMGCRYAFSFYKGMVTSLTSMDDLSIMHAAISFAEALLASYKKGKIHEGFVNTSHLQNTFSYITKENRNKIIDLLVEHNWLLTTTSDRTTELNKGYPRGKAYPGDTIYHLNTEEVEEQIDYVRKREMEKEKARKIITELLPKDIEND